MATEPAKPDVPKLDLAAGAVLRARKALKLVSANLPHLAGLAHTVRVKASRRYPVAAIGATGLLVVNPRVFSESPVADLVYVLAHELMHLALDTFGRGGQADGFLVNVAHDYVINDILTEELARPAPLGGLRREGARKESLESIITELSQSRRGQPQGVWSIPRRGTGLGRHRVRPGKSAITEQLERAGLVQPEEPPPGDEDDPDDYPPGDAMSSEEEDALEPEVTPAERQKQRERVRRESVKAMSLRALRKELGKQEAAAASPSTGTHTPGESMMEAILTAYQPPWQLALQHWLDAVAPGPRSYSRPSRRGADRDDGVVLPGRKREGWALHVVVDTSGSMMDTLPLVLGLLASFCEGAGVNQVHILQCDVGVTVDEWIEPSQLSSYRLAGFGGSDMSPGMERLLEDPEVAAVLVLTDGYIDYPADEPPYAVLWGLVNGDESFEPRYGSVVHVRT